MRPPIASELNPHERRIRKRVNGAHFVAGLVILVSVAILGCLAEAGEIHDAARRNDLDKIKELLARDPKLIDSRDGDRRHPLHLAARWATPEIVSYLIGKGADVNSRCYNQFTPMHLTSDVEIAKVLVKHGADLEARDASNRTPLGGAVDHEHQEMIDFLLKAGGGRLDFESLVKLGRTEQVAGMLKERPWLAKAPREPLFTAAGRGDVEMAKLLLRYGANPDHELGPVMNSSGRYTALTSAIIGGNYEITELLLEHGALPNVTGPKLYDSALHFVVGSRDIRFLQIMLEHGADVDSREHLGISPLHVAAETGSVEKAKLLLNFDADINAEHYPTGTTPLFLAAVGGRKEFCDFLLSQGARLDFHSACALGKRPEVEAMLRRDPELANSRDRRLHRTALALAVQSGDVPLAEVLIARGAEVDAASPRVYRFANVVSGPRADHDGREKGGDTPLHVAVRSGDSAMIRFLLDKGADVNARDEDGRTVLHMTDDPKTVRLLLDRGANLDAKTRPYLLRGAIDNHELLEMLLESTPQEELSGKLGESLLQRAAERNQTAAVKLLESRGTSLNVFAASILGRTERVAELLAADPGLVRVQRDRNPRDLLAIAASHGHLKLVKLLVSKSAPLTDRDNWYATPVEAASRGGHHDVVAFLIDKGADVNHRNMYAATPLHVAAASGHLAVVKLLIQRKADVNVRDINRNTALHKAASNGAVDVARYLVELGLSVDARNIYSETPLHRAATSGETEMAALLVELGADVNARNRRGKTPLFYAERQFDPAYFPEGPDRNEIAKLLREHGAGE